MDELGIVSVLPSQQVPGGNVSAEPEVVILEQPAPRTLRFRYECEGRLAGCLTGVNSTPDNKTFPTIQVKNFHGLAVVLVSCVTKDPPHYPHPHRIVGKEGCKDGIYSTEIRSPDMIQSFTGLGIQCVKKKDVETSLSEREAKKIDPFKTGFDHKTQPSSIDLNVVRLCFQVFLLSPCKTRKCMLKPVVSNPIYDKKAHSDLSIHKLSHYTAPVSGGTDVILLCEKVNKDMPVSNEGHRHVFRLTQSCLENISYNVQVKFFEKKGEQEVWKDYAKFQPSDIHKQVAISFKTPPYHDINVSHEVDVWIQLERPSDNSVGVPRKFKFLPVDRDPESLYHKRIKFEEGCYDAYIKSTVSPSVAGNQGGVIHVPREKQRPVKIGTRHRTPGATPMDCPADYKTLSQPPMPEAAGMPIINPVMPYPLSQFRTDGMSVAHYPIPPMGNVTSSKQNRDIDYQRTEETASNHSDFAIRTAISVASVPFSGGTLLHSFPSTSANNLGQIPIGAQNNSMFPLNVPPLSDESNSSPPSPASLNIQGAISLQQSTDKFNLELQMSVEDATEKLGSLTVDPNEILQLPSDASISASDWRNIDPTLQLDSEFMVSEGGHTDEMLRQARQLQRELVELRESTLTARDCDETN